MGIKDIASGLMSKGQQTASDLGKRAGDLSGKAAMRAKISADANGDGSVTADEVRAAVADKARAAAVAASGAAAAASGAAAAAFGKMRESLAKGEQVGEEIVVDEIVGESESGGDAGDGSVERDVEPVEEAAIEEEDRSE